MKLKQNYIKFKLDGVLYDFSNYNDERLKRLWENNPNMRFIFEPIEAEQPIEVSIQTTKKRKSNGKKS